MGKFDGKALETYLADKFEFFVKLLKLRVYLKGIDEIMDEEFENYLALIIQGELVDKINDKEG